MNFKKSIFFIIFTTFLLLLFFNIGSWSWFSYSKNVLNNAVDEKLLSIGKTIVSTSNSLEDIFISGENNELALIILQNKLEQVKNTNNLERIFVVGPERLFLIDTSDYDQKNSSHNVLFKFDKEVLDAAWGGEKQVTKNYEISGSNFKTACLPVENVLGEVVLGVLCLESSADELKVFSQIRNMLFLTGGLSILFFSVFIVIQVFLAKKIIVFQKELAQNERLALQGSMAAHIAHEIKNPLAIIRGTAERLKKKYDKDFKDPIFNFIPEEVVRLNRILSEFLLFAKKPVFKKSSINADEFIENILDSFSTNLEIQDIKIEKDFNAKDCFLNIDTDKFKQVLLNLLLNALDAMNNKGAIRVTTLYCKENKKFWELMIEDSGVGFNLSKQNKLFTPFYTTKTKGTGLGLVNAKKIVEAHKGIIVLENAPKGGALIRIKLPVGVSNEES